jgi:hypothetical protein
MVRSTSRLANVNALHGIPEAEEQRTTTSDRAFQERLIRGEAE